MPKENEIIKEFREEFEYRIEKFILTKLKEKDDAINNIKEYFKSEMLKLYEQHKLELKEERIKTLEEVMDNLEKSKLVQILRYAFSRGCGHTYAQLKGVENTPNAILVVANEQQKLSTGLPRKKQISINADVSFFRGRRHPVVIDHYALSTMVEEILHTINTLNN